MYRTDGRERHMREKKVYLVFDRRYLIKMPFWRPPLWGVMDPFWASFSSSLSPLALLKFFQVLL